MTSRPFHHGNLRAVLLGQAEVMLRDVGADGLSLRELARQAGVSHGAPRSHFIDRQALLNALAEQGFHRLTDKIRVALTSEGTFKERFRLLGHAYVDFVVDDAALMELMFATKMNDPVGPVQEAAVGLFQVLDEAIGPCTEGASSDARDRFKLLFAAAMQGTATLIAARRITRSQGEVIIDDASNVLLMSELGARVISQPSRPHPPAISNSDGGLPHRQRR